MNEPFDLLKQLMPSVRVDIWTVMAAMILISFIVMAFGYIKSVLEGWEADWKVDSKRKAKSADFDSHMREVGRGRGKMDTSNLSVEWSEDDTDDTDDFTSVNDMDTSNLSVDWDHNKD